MDYQLLNIIYQQNPWLQDKTNPLITENQYIQRLQYQFLAQSDWDKLWTILVGPRQAGKTTLGKHLCQGLIRQHRYQPLLYLNCDYYQVRHWLKSPTFLSEAAAAFSLKNYILFIDEAQRLESPGLLLKIIADLQLPIKMIASGSSQLEIKSKIQEHLTGRQIESVILPLSCREIDFANHWRSLLQYGSYPQVYLNQNKLVFLQELFNSYVQKDIIEFLRVGKPEVVLQLLALLAHACGQLLNFQQLAVDCRVNVETIRHYIDIFEKTYVIKTIKPFVGNKRTELTSNPICYFIDNGFRNQALNNFAAIENRTDNGLLVQNLVFQEIYKYQMQERKNWQIHYWRTKAGAEVDFVIQTGFDTIIPIEVKFRNTKDLILSRSYRSFLDAYQPAQGYVITKNQTGELNYPFGRINFIPLCALPTLFENIT
ncbi:MAG TPA: ATP-binding protein [Gammaproteobacteria bacterium]|nr:ATP-binding protein [Gammaproteobacteria bacterium]